MASLDPDDPRPPYLQVAGHLREDIESGKLGPGVQLPTYADLGEEFGVAVNTAKSAVNQLRDEGLVVVRQGKGSFVRMKTITGEPAGGLTGSVERLWQELADVKRRLAALEQSDES
jgi:GntR family transcriptional regulator